uniref:Uncharacterized protein n=1 Tax=Alexandrium andersonii TaxID=327968 RepID=A0A7S2HEM7_9DINO|mmetsp:Transcript_70692/g.158277  ORF Transcript_70692/g.158277 Transcript_70692/m.158277 type:complete len:236 (+) Transcript_70692:84-791(+)
MPSVSAVLLVGSLAQLASSSRDGLGDAFAAYQQRIREVDLARMPQMMDSRHVHSAFDFLPTVEELVRQKRGGAAQAEGPREARIQWSVLQQETGPGGATIADLSASSGCRAPTLKGKKRMCLVPLEPASNASIEVTFMRPVYGNTNLEMVLNVNSLATSEKISCPVCGQTCKGKLLGHDWSMDMPPCPILKSWSVKIPMDLMSKVPTSFAASWDTRIRREDRIIALEYQTELATI